MELKGEKVNKELEQLAIKITRISLSPLYDDDTLYRDNQDTFIQYRVDLGSDKIAEYIYQNYIAITEKDKLLKEIEMYRTEILRLGGSLKKEEFGKIIKKEEK